MSQIEQSENQEPADADLGTEDKIEDLDSLIEQTHHSAEIEWYSDTFDENADDWGVSRDVRNNLKKSVLIDLGSSWGVFHMVKYAIRMEVKKYIGVDRFYTPDIEKLKDEDNELHSKMHKIEAEGKQQDMLLFLQDQSDDSSNIVINGMDGQILGTVRWKSEITNEELEAGKKYVELLAVEIQRVVGKDHIVFGANSDPVFTRLKKLGFTEKAYRGISESETYIMVLRPISE